MKVKCIDNQTSYNPKTGDESELIDGLTVGKVYEAQVIPITKFVSPSAGNVLTEIQFFIFNDNNSWILLDTRHFALE